MQAKARARFAFSEFLGRSGRRCTPERLHILDVVMEQRKPFTGEQLLALCGGRDSISICRATLFNTLPLLVEGGFMRRMAHDKTIRYEAVRPGAVAKPRLYMICSVCGKVHKSDAPSLAAWAEDVAMRGFVPQTESAVVYLNGVCARCRRGQNPTRKSKSLKSTKEI